MAWQHFEGMEQYQNKCPCCEEEINEGDDKAHPTGVLKMESAKTRIHGRNHKSSLELEPFYTEPSY